MFLKLTNLTLWGYGLQSPLNEIQRQDGDQFRDKMAVCAIFPLIFWNKYDFETSLQGILTK